MTAGSDGHVREFSVFWHNGQSENKTLLAAVERKKEKRFAKGPNLTLINIVSGTKRD